MLILGVAVLVAVAVAVWPARLRSWPPPPGVLDGSGSAVAPVADDSALGAVGPRGRWQIRRGRADDGDRLLGLLDAIVPALVAGLPPVAALGHLSRREASREGTLRLPTDRVDALLADLVTESIAGRPLAPVWARHAAAGSPRASGTGSASGTGRAPGRAGRSATARWSSQVAFVARAWSLSESLGSPLAECVTVAARTVRQHSARQRRLDIALAGPRATATVLTALPLAGPVVGLLLGLSPGQLYGSPVAIIATAAGLALLLVGRWWCARLVAGITRARPAGRQARQGSLPATPRRSW